MKLVLDSNIQILQKYIPNIKEIASRLANRAELHTIQTVTSRTSEPTVQVCIDGKSLFVHSKYDPRNEAKQWVESKQEQMQDANQVFLYGLGLGYHVEELVKKYPNIRIVIYEPSPVMFYKFISERDLQQFPFKNMQQLHIEMQEDDNKAFLYKLLSSVAEELILLELPAYTRVFSDKYKKFIESFQEVMNSKRSNIVTEFVFSARWTLNSLLNLPYTISTPNLLSGGMTHLKGKPAIIVSAGPGLSYEYENLRKIKEEGLAYIIAVGSGGRALINKDIYPDAVATYDPKETNHWVLHPIYSQNIDSIPLIYGSSVGYEILEKYCGDKYHTITDKDTVTPYYLNDNQNTDVVKDAPSIAVVTYQLLTKWNCSPIILVGQNFCLENRYAYAKETVHGTGSALIKDKDISSIIPAIDIHGKEVETLPGYLRMKRDVEWYISLASNISTINTTKGGLDISGSAYCPLDEVIIELNRKKIENRQELSALFRDLKASNSPASIAEQVTKMDEAMRAFDRIMSDFSKTLRYMQDHHDRRHLNKIIKNLNKFDEHWHALITNDYFIVYIKSILQVKYEILINRATIIQNEQDIIKRSAMILKEFNHFFAQCEEVYNYVGAKVKAVHLFISADKLSNEQCKQHRHDAGVFKYTGIWDRHLYHKKDSNVDKIQRYRYDCTMSNNTNATIRFRFTGSMLRIYACRSSEHSNNIKISIDDTIYKYSQNSNYGNKHVPDEIESLVFEVDGLEYKEHRVCIELLDDMYISLAGIETDLSGRAYHIDEVTSLSDMRIGKRIRCHYKAERGKVGEISGRGEAKADFLAIESIDEPDGDFYFIMVDTNEQGKKMLIADRNIQNYISWDTLKEAGLIEGKPMETMELRLLMGGRAYLNQAGVVIVEDIVDEGFGVWPEDNEWDRYITSNVIGQEFDWNYKNMGSWCLDTPMYDPEQLLPDKGAIVRGLMYSVALNSHVNLVVNSTKLEHLQRAFRPMCIIE